MKTVTYSIRASQLEKVRLVCKRDGCGAVAEIDVSKLSKTDDKAMRAADLRCPGCGKQNRIDTDLGRDHLYLLGLAIQAAKSHAEAADVEFVLSAEEDA